MTKQASHHHRAGHVVLQRSEDLVHLHTRLARALGPTLIIFIVFLTFLVAVCCICCCSDGCLPLRWVKHAALLAQQQAQHGALFVRVARESEPQAFACLCGIATKEVVDAGQHLLWCRACAVD